MTIARTKALDRIWKRTIAPRVGQCFLTRVKEVGPRLEGGSDDPNNDGVAINYADGHYQVDYTTNRFRMGFKAGDPVRLCTVSLPKNCPIGDHRGITYRALDLRSYRIWEAADHEHMCGGA